MSEFIISRIFNAPVDVIFEMWVDPKHVGQWLAPKGGMSQGWGGSFKQLDPHLTA